MTGHLTGGPGQLLVAVLTALATWLIVSPPSADHVLERVRRARRGMRGQDADRLGEGHPAGARRPGRGAEPAAARVSELADVADLLALVLSAGCGVVEALELVGAHYPGVLGRQLCSVAAAARWGLEEPAQWSTAAPEWSPVRGAFRLAAESGVPPAEVLSAAADDLRRAEAHRVEVAASKLGAKAVLPLGLAFLPAFVLTTVLPVVLMLAGDLLGP